MPTFEAFLESNVNRNVMFMSTYLGLRGDTFGRGFSVRFEITFHRKENWSLVQFISSLRRRIFLVTSIAHRMLVLTLTASKVESLLWWSTNSTTSWLFHPVWVCMICCPAWRLPLTDDDFFDLWPVFPRMPGILLRWQPHWKVVLELKSAVAISKPLYRKCEFQASMTINWAQTKASTNPSTMWAPTIYQNNRQSSTDSLHQ